MYQHILTQLLLAFDKYSNEPTAMDMRLFKFGVEKKVYTNKTLLIFKRHREISLDKCSCNPNSHLPIVVVYVTIGKHGHIVFETQYTSDSVFIIPKCMYDFSISTNIILSTPVFSEVTVQEAMDDIWNVYKRYNNWLSNLFSIFTAKDIPTPSREWRFLNNGQDVNGLPELLESISLRTKDIFRASNGSWLIKRSSGSMVDKETELYYVSIDHYYTTVSLVGKVKDYHIKLDYEYSLEAGLHTDWLTHNQDQFAISDSLLKFSSGKDMLKCFREGLSVNVE